MLVFEGFFFRTCDANSSCLLSMRLCFLHCVSHITSGCPPSIRTAFTIPISFHSNQYRVSMKRFTDKRWRHSRVGPSFRPNAFVIFASRPSLSPYLAFPSTKVSSPSLRPSNTMPFTSGERLSRSKTVSQPVLLLH
jgi:hypothetical protein